MQIETVCFIVDESGAKGYSDKREKEAGEFGVMAGFFVLKSDLPTVSSELAAIQRPYQMIGKSHITDLPSDEQESLRRSTFEYFIKRKIPWSYEAIYVEGLHNHRRSISALVGAAKAQRRSNVRFSNHEDHDSLHSKLFQGIFGKGIAFCVENVGEKCILEIITDRVDAPILKDFKQSAFEFMDIGNPQKEIVNGFDLGTRKPVQGSIVNTSAAEIGSISELIGDFSGISYSINCQDSPLTFAADVLAQSVYRWLRKAQTLSLGVSLNTDSVIADHPIAELVYGTWADPDWEDISGSIYRHPNKNDK